MASAALLLAYGFLPLAAETNTGIVVRIISPESSSLLFVVYEIQMISKAEFPQLRAADALMVGVTLIVVVFASTYLSMSKASPGAFSESLDRTGAMYLTMTTLSTIGYGDVVAARIRHVSP